MKRRGRGQGGVESGWWVGGMWSASCNINRQCCVMEPTQKEAQNNHIEFGFFGGAERCRATGLTQDVQNADGTRDTHIHTDIQIYTYIS